MPTRDLPCEGRLFKDVLDGIHVGNQPRGEVKRVLPQLAQGLCYGITCLFDGNVINLIASELLAQVVNRLLFFIRFI